MHRADLNRPGVIPRQDAASLEWVKSKATMPHFMCFDMSVGVTPWATGAIEKIGVPCSLVILLLGITVDESFLSNRGMSTTASLFS